MKIICDCGEILDIEIDEDIMDEGSYLGNKKGNMTLVSEHDEIWIRCENCGLAVHINC